MPNNNKEKKPNEIKLTITNQIKLDPLTPVPIAYNGNSFRIVGGKKYLPFLGRKDDLPNLLLEARLTSTTQNACITSIAQSAVGKGIFVKGEENPNQDLFNWFKCVNNKGQSFNDVMRAIVDGERTYGNQFIEIKRGTLGKKRFIKIYLHSMLFSRLNEPEDYSDPTAVVISKRIAQSGYILLREDALKIPLWSANILDQKAVWLKNDDKNNTFSFDSAGTESTMLHFKNEVGGVEHYGLPASIAGLRYQVLEGLSAQYNIDNFENNMILGGMLILKSAMTQEEAQAQAKEILLSHMGQGKTGRIAVLSSENGLADVDFKPFNTKNEGSFIELDKRMEEKIIAANNWAGEFIGIDRKGALGRGSAYVRSIYDVKDAVLLDPLEKRLIDKVISPIIQIYADWMRVPEILKYDFRFQTAMPFSLMGDINPETFMKVNEARQLAGLQPDDVVGEKYLSEMTSKSNNVQTQSAASQGTDNNG